MNTHLAWGKCFVKRSSVFVNACDAGCPYVFLSTTPSRTFYGFASDTMDPLSSIPAALDKLKNAAEMLTVAHSTKRQELSEASRNSWSLEKASPSNRTADVLTENLTLENPGYEAKDYIQFSRKENTRYELLKEIKLPPIAFPLSQYEGWEPPLPMVKEEEALNTLMKDPSIEKSIYGDDEFFSLNLDQFTIYRDSHVSDEDEMASLHEVALKQGNTKFFFDGILNIKGEGRAFLKQVPFEFVSIGGYERVEQHTVGSDIWMQSVCGRRYGDDIWYRLCDPSPNYKPYHENFLWIADFGKHFIDFLSARNTVTLIDFKTDFSVWLKQVHGTDLGFCNWFLQFGKADFRQAIVAHYEYLFKQALDINRKYGKAGLWREIGLTEPILKKQYQQQTEGTIVTPYAYRCFQNMEWGEQLQVAQPEPAVLLKQQARIRELGFEYSVLNFRFKPLQGGLCSAPVPHKTFEIRPGDVISVTRDEETVWKTSSDEDLWYAFVQCIRHYQNGTIWLDVIWLYRPGDTVCANMTYPHANELFMSDHCNCGDRKIQNIEVVGKVDVTFFSSVARGAPYFVRQTYCTDDEVFLTLKEEDFYCHHRKKRSGMSDCDGEAYQPGDTVLVETGSILEPMEIVSCGNKALLVRELLRRARDFNEPERDPNELVYTDRTRSIYVGHVERRCHIRFYSEYERNNGLIPPPYCRQGNGDAFYITSREIKLQEGTRCLQPLDSSCLPISLKQGFDPTISVPKLRGLNIFSGGGSFDRGLEEGTAVRNDWAVEWSKAAMLTYRANLTNPGAKLFWGSVDDFLHQSLKDIRSNIVARVGEVDFISAGSPCQGYALTNNFKQSQKSLRNCSMIASVAAFIDHFRPNYAILENVTAMAKRSDKNPLSQMLCALVGMGYQARILNLDSWSFGAPQSRSRLFIFVAAPGLKLPEHPALTHSHPPKTKNRSLGEAANGLPFGCRRFETSVFDFVTASEATKDLPRVGTAKVMAVSDPDHRTVQKINLYKQTLIELVPKAPWTQGLDAAVTRGWMAQPQTEAFSRRRKVWKMREANAYGRVHPKGLIPTITTKVVPSCMFTGRLVHWEEDRLLTIKEARRAQGFPDDEVLIGSTTDQWKIIGNSVARQVALALGMTLRDACLENERKKDIKIAIKATSDAGLLIDGSLTLINNHTTIKQERGLKDSHYTPMRTPVPSDALSAKKQLKLRRIIRSETSTQETTHREITTITDRLIEPGDATPSCVSDSSSAVIISEHEWKQTLESNRKRLREFTINTSRSQKRRRMRRLVVLDSDDER